MPTKKTSVLVNFILDKSGSMESVRDATISGFNEYIGTLKKDTKGDYRLSLTLFDTNVSYPIVNTPLEEMKDLSRETYDPNGNTALYDAICGSIKNVEKKAINNEKILFVVMTDGQENSSREYTQSKMREMIDACEKRGNWTFVYLGANQDSFAIGAQYGFSKMNVTNYDASAVGTRSVMASIASNTMDYTECDASMTMAFFSEEDQERNAKMK